MMLTEVSIRKPVSVAVGVILVLLFGVIAFLEIPIQLTPNIDKARITVQTRWGGVSPKEIEREIVEEQEDYLKSVEGLEKMTS